MSIVTIKKIYIEDDPHAFIKVNTTQESDRYLVISTRDHYFGKNKLIITKKDAKELAKALNDLAND